MNKNFLLFFSLLAMLSCTHERKAIDFKKMANFDLGIITKKTATLHGVAVFTNLTDEELTVKDMVLDFTVDGKDIGTIVVKTKKIIQPKSEFSIPVEYTYDTRRFVEEGSQPADTYAVELLGDLVTKNQKEKETSTAVKFATTYEYLTKREKRLERKQRRTVNQNEDSDVSKSADEKKIDRKEDRKRRREERRAKRESE
jgi:hypothetical protein